jgi:hypothetical protein
MATSQAEVSLKGFPTVHVLLLDPHDNSGDNFAETVLTGTNVLLIEAFNRICLPAIRLSWVSFGLSLSSR